MIVNPSFNLIPILLFIIGICFGKGKIDTTGVININLVSKSFRPKSSIPSKYTCQGQEISPPFNWDKGPENTRSYAIIMTDPDVPIPFVTITHWIVYNISADQTSLSENIPAGKKLENGISQGKRTFGKYGYMGPCPPFGEHRYFFRIYALDKMLDIPPQKASRRRIMKVIQEHVVGFGEMYGLYAK